MQLSGNVLRKRAERLRTLTFFLFLSCWLPAACMSASAPANTPANTPARTITIYNWVDYLPQSVIDAFEAETGIGVEYVVYETQEEAVAALRGGAAYDLVVLTTEYIPDLIAGGYIAPIDARSIPNRKNIPANFRDLTFDLGNRYAIPYHWGTTGLLARTDLLDKLPTRWADLWDERYAGKVALWPLQASLLPIALKMLGYSINSENPAEIAQAMDELEKLRKQAFWVGNENATVVPVLAEGEAVLAYGWAYDALLAKQEGLPIGYILPEEGSILWADYLLIPAASRHQAEAMQFLDFLLRPEIGAQLVAESYYPVANDAALEYIDPALLADPTIYPPPEVLAGAELTQPVSEAAKQMRDAAWNRFLADE
jgi:spermidine/putrescine transport system substrate-binding protein